MTGILLQSGAGRFGMKLADGGLGALRAALQFQVGRWTAHRTRGNEMMAGVLLCLGEWALNVALDQGAALAPSGTLVACLAGVLYVQQRRYQQAAD